MNKQQKQYADQFFKDNPEVKQLHLNPQGEWFTDLNYANNSLPRVKEGEKGGKIETIKKGQKIDASEEDDEPK